MILFVQSIQINYSFQINFGQVLTASQMGNLTPICQDIYLQSEQISIKQVNHNDNEQVLDQMLELQQNQIQQDNSQKYIQQSDHKSQNYIQQSNHKIIQRRNQQQKYLNQEKQKQIRQKFTYIKDRQNLSQKNYRLKLSRKTLQTNKIANNKNKNKQSKVQNYKNQREFTQKQKQIKNLIQQSHTFFKQLKIVQIYQKKYEYIFQFNNDNQKKISNIQFRDKEHLQYHNFLISILQILQRLHRTGKHKNILKLIYQIDKEYVINPTLQTLQKIQRLKQSIVRANLQFLDMLYYKLPEYQSQKQQSKLKMPTRQNFFNSNEQQRKKCQITKIIDVKKIIMSKNEELKQKSYYETCKNIGFDIYRQNKVCFYILAGETNDIFWQNSPFKFGKFNKSQNKGCQVKELVPLNLPSSPSILKILLSRYDAFASILQVTSLTVIIFTNNQKFEYIQNYILQNRSTYKKLLISVVCQTEQAVLDKHGNLVLNDQKEIIFYPNGSGDLWDHMIQQQQDCGTLKQLKSKGFQFIQVIGTNNCLQHCFDCFMMGLCQNKQLKWGTKVIQIQRNHHKSNETKKSSKISSLKSSQIMKNSHKQNQLNFAKLKKFNENILEGKTQKICSIRSEFLEIEQGEVESKIFFKNNQKVYKKDPNQVSQNKIELDNCEHIFTNHSILSVGFIQQVLKSQKWKQERIYRKKIVYNNEKQSQLIIFETDYTDIFNFTQTFEQLQQNSNRPNRNYLSYQQSPHNFFLFKYERQNQFHPLSFYEKGIFDIQSCSKAISIMHLSYLDLQKFFGNKCYIDPHVSLQGQNLTELKLELKNRLKQDSEQPIFPLHIFQHD